MDNLLQKPLQTSNLVYHTKLLASSQLQMTDSIHKQFSRKGIEYETYRKTCHEGTKIWNLQECLGQSTNKIHVE